MRRKTKTGKPAKRQITMASIRAFEARINRSCIRDYSTSLYSFDAPTLHAVFPARYRALVRLRRIAAVLEKRRKERYLQHYNIATHGLHAISA